MSKTKNMVIDQLNEQNEKRQTIQYLTGLMATIQAAHFKGRLHDRELRVHESGDADSTAISIDLYHFEGDGKDVCDGLHDLTITFDDGSQDTGWLFCMHYDPDGPTTPLTFLFMPDGDEEDYDIDPELVPLDVLQNITRWLEQEAKAKRKEATVPVGSPTGATPRDIIDRWTEFCYNHPPYDEVILWMVGGSKTHYLYQHFCRKFDHHCDRCQHDTAAAWYWFYRELDSEWAERLVQYVFNEWKRNK